MQTQAFYNRYHKKNSAYTKIMRRSNFTYFYILQFLHRPDLERVISGKILDVGCGVGTLALYLAQFAQQVVGIDVSDRAIKIAQTAANANQLTNTKFQIKRLTVQKNKYDLVLATEIIEHIKNDQKFLLDIYASLRPGGYLLLSTPSNSSQMYQWGWYSRFDQEVGHLRRYSTGSLTKLLQNSGFKVIVLTQRESWLRSILFTTSWGKVIRYIRGPFIPLFHWCDEVSGKILGFTDIIVLAQKKS